MVKRATQLRISLTFNSSFQDTRGLQHTTHFQGCGLSIPHFRIRDSTVSGHQRVEFTFQFLILGYVMGFGVVVLLQGVTFNSSFQDTRSKGVERGVGRRLSIPHFRILVGKMYLLPLFQLCLSIPHFRIPLCCCLQVYVGVYLSIPHFRILGHEATAQVITTKLFQFLILGYLGCDAATPCGYLCFQFLILGYQERCITTTYTSTTFNSSFQDTRVTLEKI